MFGSCNWLYTYFFLNRYNIGYGRPGASFEEIQEAAKAADMHEQILGFPDGITFVIIILILEVKKF